MKTILLVASLSLVATTVYAQPSLPAGASLPTNRPELVAPRPMPLPQMHSDIPKTHPMPPSGVASQRNTVGAPSMVGGSSAKEDDDTSGIIDVTKILHRHDTKTASEYTGSAGVLPPVSGLASSASQAPKTTASGLTGQSTVSSPQRDVPLIPDDPNHNPGGGHIVCSIKCDPSQY
jgi:hypothetical protein